MQIRAIKNSNYKHFIVLQSMKSSILSSHKFCLNFGIKKASDRLLHSIKDLTINILLGGGRGTVDKTLVSQP